LLHAQCDLQAGGKWRVKVAGASTDEVSCSTVCGRYQTIEPPHLLTYSWIRENDDLPETLVRWDLTEKDGYTTVRVTHSG
jgi:uncharacterized protein YndB with AHSA1/START domain